MYSISTRIYSPNEVNQILDENVEFIKNNKKIEYTNIPCSFDIETTSFYEDNKKRATMYAFVIGINGKCVIGRTWDEAIAIFNQISEFYHLDVEHRMIVFVHNLSYEFQFIRKLFTWERVFSLEQRKPVQAITNIGIEFRCSYLLSGYGLKKVGENLTKYKVEKKVGDLDYSKMRHSKTPLTQKELGYILNDGLVVMSYIQERIEHDGNITKIPLTKTGYVRTYCRNKCLYEGSHKHNVKKYLSYHRLMSSLQITSIKEYQQLKRALQGGFTHANAFYSGQIVEDVTSYDFTSSYPAVMISEKFPMSTGKLVTIKSIEEFKNYIRKYCCLFDVEFIEIENTTTVEHPISSSKCWKTSNIEIDNGRVVRADAITTTITEQDFLIIRKFYKWKRIRIWNFRIYKKGYLPTDFVKSILDLYFNKTTLKDVPESIAEYMHSKEDLNSCYGMAVTDICRDEIIYDDESGEWSQTKVDVEKSLKKYNQSKQRFLFYPWGIWVTAYARRNLFTGIYEFGDDYIYSDTDSIKGKNIEKHMPYIEDYNDKMLKKLKMAMDFHHLPMDLVSPKTIKGKVKTIGYWDFDGHYKRFKTLGAKRYLVEKDDGKISLTVSGVNKEEAIPFLQNKYDDVFDAFEDGLHIPKDHTGKNIHTYIDEACDGILIDYKGIPNKYHEEACIHMEASEYSLSLSDAYIEYLLGIKEFIE